MTNEPNYEIERREGTEATVRVAIAPETFQQSLDAVYRRYAKEVRIPGFRKGHVPRNVLDSRFGPELFIEEAKEDLERKHLPAALVKLGLRPVSRPRVEALAFEPSDPFVFTASFSILPEVELPEIRGRKVAVPSPPPVSDEDVHGALQEVQGHLATLEPKEGEAVAEGDIVHVREGTQEWDAQASADDEVTKPLIGASIGEKVSVDVEVADGKRPQTTLEVAGLRQVVLPEVDDEMAKDAGFDSLEALKADIVEKITGAREKRHRQLIESAVLSQIVGEAGIDLPEAFVEELAAEDLERFKASFEEPQSTGTFEEYLESQQTDEETLLGRIRESVTRRLQHELVLRRIAASEEIGIDDEQLEEIAKADAEGSGEEPIRFVARLKADDRWDDYRISKINERVLDLLRETAVVSEAKADETSGLVIDPSKERGDSLIIDPSKEGGGA